MSEKSGSLPKAKVVSTRLTWIFWLAPIAAVGLCAWFVVRDVVLVGPTITVYFDKIDGLQKANTFLQYRGVNVGAVTGLRLTSKMHHAAVEIQLIESASDLARAGSIFWIVRPEVKLGAISGLRTIVSGNYVAIQPGEGPRTNKFIGAEEEPVEHKGALEITLLSPQLGSLQNGSPVFYRGIEVGEVLSSRLASDSRNVMIDAFVRTNYAPLVRVNSKFWNAGGLNFHFGLFSGAQISAESAATLIGGGIEFATPIDYQDVATNGATFVLNEKEDAAWKKWDPGIALQNPPVEPKEPGKDKDEEGLFNLGAKH